MYLKSLELHGFKSFAQKTVLVFEPQKDERQSITAIVGPNGSGKSNVSDAIRWAMGEQSMKTLRGKKSEDIVFSGSEARGKMGFASVVMTLDNSDHRIPVDYDDVIVARRLDRDGESQYLMNGNTVRLFDLQVLLAQAQFGHGAYSVIGQGTIDRLLLHTPVERKEFFDEACGIKEFQIKQHQASLKLDRTRTHIGEAELLLQEIAPRLRLLSRQVKKLEERQEIETKLRGIQETYYVSLWRLQQKALQQFRAERQRVDESLAQEEKTLLALQEELATIAREGSREEQFQILQRHYEELLSQKTLLEREEMVLSTKLQTEYSTIGSRDVGWLVSKIETVKKDEDASKTDHYLSESIAEQASVARLSAEENERKLHEERQVCGQKIETLTALVRTLEEQPLLARAEASALESILHRPTLFGTVYGVVADLGHTGNEYVLALDIAAGAQLSSVVVHDDTVAEQWIRYLRESRLGIATFLPMNTIKPRVIPHDIDRLLGENGVHGLAKDLLSYDKKFETIFSFIFGSTLVVEDIHHARRIGIGKIRMVTLAGDLIETSGSMKGGYRLKSKSSFSFGKENERRKTGFLLQEKEKELSEMREEYGRLEKAWSEAREITRQKERDHEAAKSRLHLAADRLEHFRREREGLEEEYNLLTSDPSHRAVIMVEIQGRHNDIGNQIKQIQHDVQNVQSQIANFHQEEEKKKQHIFILQGEMQSVQSTLSRLTQERNDAQVEVAKLETKQEDLIREVGQELHEHIDFIVKRGISDIGEDKFSEMERDIQKLKYALSLIGGIDPEVMKEYEETRIRHDGLTTQLDDLKRAMADLKTLTLELDDLMKKKRNQTFRTIRKEFARYFELLFGGGKADIVELFTEDVQDGGATNDGGLDGHGEGGETSKNKQTQSLVGIDIVATPPGKKVMNIQALSGGERTMTSIALLCAILRTNPPPFVVLDEVEAALDEANTVRFGQILKELALFSQFIIITHNRVTMHIADTLYGVTMGNDGTSRVVSVHLQP